MDLITNKIIFDESINSTNTLSFVPSLNLNNLNNIIKLNKQKLLKKCNNCKNCNECKFKTEIEILNTSVGDNYKDIVKNRKNICLIRKRSNARLNLLNKKIDYIKNNIIEGTLFFGFGYILYTILFTSI